MARAGLDAARVVEEAAALADSEGLAALSLSVVAERLGVRTPSLYHHVEGLPGLRRLVALAGTRALGEALREAAIGRAGDDAVRAVAQAYRRFARRHPGQYEASLAAPPRGDSEQEAAARRVGELVFAVLRGGYGLEGEGLVHATRGLRAALHGFVALEAAGGFGLPESRDASFEQLVELMIAGLHALGDR